MHSEDEEVDELQKFIQREIRKSMGNMVDNYIYVSFVGPELADANLSKVQLPGGGGLARFVPKLAHVTGLTAGQTLLCIKSKTVPLTIIGRPVGDISLAVA